MATKSKEFSGYVEAYCHRVHFSYWDFNSALTPELEVRLREDAEERIRESIAQECVCGELNSLNQDNDEEIRGWWKIQR